MSNQTTPHPAADQTRAMRILVARLRAPRIHAADTTIIEDSERAALILEQDYVFRSRGHSDDAAVERFAVMMKDKLAASRYKGRAGWERCSEPVLMEMLREHIKKGDMVDVANLAMMVHLNRQARLANRG